MWRYFVSLSVACMPLLEAVADPPQQIHVAYAGAITGTAMTISWQTTMSHPSSVVKYGLSKSNLVNTASGSVSSYYATYDYHVVISQLTPGTMYFYSCGDTTAGFSPVYNFTTAPAAGNEFPLKVAVFGDIGIYNSKDTVTDLYRVRSSVNFLLTVGDSSYADDDYLKSPLVDKYEYTWNAFMNMMQPFASGLAYMVLPGNHEAECHSPICFTNSNKRSAFKNFTAYNRRFRMPAPESGGTLNMWYSFDYGSVHFVQIDTETDFPGATNDEYSSKNGNFGDQMGWLENDLSAAAQRRSSGSISWIIVSGHRPIYSRILADGTGNPSGEAATAQSAFESLFQQYGVNIYFCGHEHSVEVSWPVYQNTVSKSYSNPPYPVYVVTGAGGCDEGHTSYASVAAKDWNRYTDDSNYGISILTVSSATSLSWEFRRATDGTVLDTFTLTRSGGPTSTCTSTPAGSTVPSSPLPSLSMSTSASTSRTVSPTGSATRSPSPSSTSTRSKTSSQASSPTTSRAASSTSAATASRLPSALSTSSASVSSSASTTCTGSRPQSASTTQSTSATTSLAPSGFPSSALTSNPTFPASAVPSDSMMETQTPPVTASASSAILSTAATDLPDDKLVRASAADSQSFGISIVALLPAMGWMLCR